MKNLVLSVSLALIIGKSPATVEALNDFASGSSTANGGNSTRVTYQGSLNSNGTLNTNLASNATSSSTNTSDISLKGNNSTSSNSHDNTARVFLMDEDINWSNSNFSIYDQSGIVVYQITSQNEGEHADPKEFVVQDAQSGVNKLTINARAKWCGFGQTYEADDGTKFRLNPRAFLSDRWYIKSPSEESEYVYERSALSIEGKIYENERVVAQVTSHNDSIVAAASTRKLSFQSDGTIPPWDLIALLAIVKTRIHACGY